MLARIECTHPCNHAVNVEYFDSCTSHSEPSLHKTAGQVTQFRRALTLDGKHVVELTLEAKQNINIAI